MDRQTEDQRPAVFIGGAATTWNSSPQLCIFLLLSLPFHFCMTFVHSFVVSVLCYIQYFVSVIFISGLFLVFCLLLLDLVVMPSPSSVDLASTLAAKLPEVQCYFFLTVYTLKNKLFFILCNNVIFLFGTKVNAYLILCVCM